MEPWQAEALTLEQPTTVLLAPRQTGKSRSLSVLAVHRSLTRRNHATLIVSAGEDAARRLLSSIRGMLVHPLLRGAVLDEAAGQVTFANGSVIRAVPASERQVRGWSVDLLLLDEASFISDDLIYGAAFPTVAARPDARIVLASTPWEASGAFHTFATMNRPDVAVCRWPLSRASWISAAFIAQMKATMPPLRFRAEFDAEFVDGGSGLFSRTDLLDAVAPYRLLTGTGRAVRARPGPMVCRVESVVSVQPLELGRAPHGYWTWPLHQEVDGMAIKVQPFDLGTRVRLTSRSAGPGSSVERAGVAR